MRPPSPYLAWNKVAGSALLLGVTAYSWVSALGLARWIPEAPWQAVLAACLIAPTAFLVWADRSSDSKPLRAAYLAAVGTGIAAVFIGAVPGSAAPQVLSCGFTAVSLGVASLLWQKDRTPPAWQRKALWSFVLCAAPWAFSANSWRPGGQVPLLFAALLMALGVTLTLADIESGTLPGRPGRRLAIITALVSLSGCLASSFIPGASAAASRWLKSLAALARTVFLQLVKPVAWLVAWLIKLILPLVSKNTEAESPLGQLPRQRPFPEPEEYVTPKAWTVVGWVLAAVLAAAFLRVLWSLLERYAARHGAQEVTEVRTSEWSAAKAAKWAAAKARELAKPLIAFASRQPWGQRGASDPLVALYAEFLSVAAESGHARKASQTPLEFSRVFAGAVPKSSLQIESISSLFSEKFYSGKRASPSEIRVLRENLKSLRVSLALDRKESTT